MKEIEELEKSNREHPELREAHKALAREIITFLHGKEEYERAINLADHLFNNKFNDLTKKDIEDLKNPKKSEESIGDVIRKNLESNKMSLGEKITHNLISGKKMDTKKKILKILVH